jgi:undecaprenyl-diphosphatase
LSILAAIILGIVQGLTEFIPVSSTAHLILAQQMLPDAHATDPHAFETIIQVGTLLPVLVYFRRDWIDLLRGLGRIFSNRRVSPDPHERMAVLILLATVPALLLGLAFNKKIEMLGDPEQYPVAYVVIGAALIGVGILMAWIDAISRKQRTLEQLTGADAAVIGVAQAVAIVPGVSRSGATITGGLLTGLTREAAARFSFLLSVPVMVAAVGYKTLKLLKEGAHMPHSEWIALGAGIIAAAIVGYFTIAFLLNYLRRHSLALFAWYRVALGLFLIGIYLMQHRAG